MLEKIKCIVAQKKEAINSDNSASKAYILEA